MNVRMYHDRLQQKCRVAGDEIKMRMWYVYAYRCWLRSSC